MVGEMSLITERPHSATVRARTACGFQLLTRSQFERLRKSESLAAYKVVATLAEVIARRLVRMDEKFVELSGSGDARPPPRGRSSPRSAASFSPSGISDLTAAAGGHRRAA